MQSPDLDQHTQGALSRAFLRENPSLPSRPVSPMNMRGWKSRSGVEEEKSLALEQTLEKLAAMVPLATDQVRQCGSVPFEKTQHGISRQHVSGAVGG